jgi:hypothetical protein
MKSPIRQLPDHRLRETEMGSQEFVHECQMSFFIHLWLEGGDRPAWRGRVNDGAGGHSIAFEDEQALLGFIRSRLLNESIVLPRRRWVSWIAMVWGRSR